MTRKSSKFKHILHILFTLYICVILVSNNAFAVCVDGEAPSCFIDLNKDKKYKFVFIGDSFIKGVGDIDNTGGYVARLKKDFKTNFKKVNIVKIARPGATTKEVFTYIKKNIYKKKTILSKIHDADAIILDLGRNDFWSKQPVIYSITTLKRLIKFLKSKSDNKIKPFITASTLVHVADWKLSQQNFIKQFNTELLKYPLITGEILQHTFPTTILSEDGLHPSPLGYTYIYKQIREQMTTSLYDVMKFHYRKVY